MPNCLRNRIQTASRRLGTFGALAGLLALSACAPERPQPTEPTLNLVTGCFQSVSATGQSYLLVACLNSTELASLQTFEPGGALAKYVRAAETDYNAAVARSSDKVTQPTLNLITGCVDGPGDLWHFLRRKKCTPGRPVSPRVELKFSLVMAAYFGQMTADAAAYRPPPSAPAPDFVSQAVFIL